ncbi:MAG: ABC transporter substrate-binding protein [bacterium]
MSKASQVLTLSGLGLLRKCGCGLLILLFLGGCGGREEGVLRVSFWAGHEEYRIEQRNINEFMRLHPGITVRLESIPFTDSFKEKTLTAFAAGTPADVILLDSKDSPTFVREGLLLDLAPYVQKLGVDLNIYYPNVLSIAMRDSALYALPKDFTPMMMFYNKRLFDEAGLPYPKLGWTWEDYLDLARQLTRDTNNDGIPDQYGTTFSHYFRYWQPWVWANGGDVLSPDGSRATGYFNSPRTEEALQFLIELRTKHGVAPHQEALALAGRTQNLFYAGRVAMTESGHWFIPNLRDFMQQGIIDIGVAPLPVPNGDPEGGEQINVMYESGWAVAKHTKHRDEAVRLAAFLAGEYANRNRAQAGLAISAIRRIAEEMVALDTTGLEKAFVDQIPKCRQPWGTTVEKFDLVEEYTQEAIEKVMIQGEEIHKAFTDAARRIDEELAR